MIVLGCQLPINLCLILIIILLRKLRNCKGYWIQILDEALRTLGFVIYRINKGNWRTFTHWKSMWLKPKLQKPQQKHGSQLSSVHEVIRFWYEVWWCYFKCLLCAECETWNNNAMNKDSEFSTFEGKTFINFSWARKTPSRYLCMLL